MIRYIGEPLEVHGELLRLGTVARFFARLLVVALILVLGACRPDVRAGQFSCIPNSPLEECPPGFRCVPLGPEFVCSPWEATLNDCGNGVLDPGEECDHSAGRPSPCLAFRLVGAADCNPDCTIRCGQYECGDGFMQGDEGCDDGNNLAGDGCGVQCQSEVLTWQELPHTNAPAPRFEHGMAYDVVNDQVVLFGGTSQDGTVLGDTWLFDGDCWNQLLLPPEQAPPPRQRHAMTYDGARELTVLFGGQNAQGALDDVWEFDGSSWRRGSTGHQGLFGAVMAFAPEPGVVITGGLKTGLNVDDGSWMYDGGWQVASDEYPWGRAYPAMAGSGELALLLLHGGTLRDNLVEWYSFSETWLWTNGGWALLDTGQTAPERQGHAMAYFSRWGKMVLFGGGGPWKQRRGETWVFNNSEQSMNWHRAATTLAPSARWHHRMVFDAARDRIVLFGGDDETGRRNDTWVLE